MLTEFYIEALLIDEGLADRVWLLWDSRIIDDELAAIAWMLIVTLWFQHILPLGPLVLVLP